MTSTLELLIQANNEAIERASKLPVKEQVPALKMISNNIDEQLKIIRLTTKSQDNGNTNIQKLLGIFRKRK